MIDFRYNKLIELSDLVIYKSNDLIIELLNNSENDLNKINKANMKLKKQSNSLVSKLELASNRSLDKIILNKNKLMKEYDRLRKSTVPYNILWFKYLQRKIYKNLSLIMQKGAHFIVALMGGGKSSFLFHTIERLRSEFGYGAYVNVDLEHPHFDPLLREYVQYHLRFEMDDYWGSEIDEETEKKVYKQYKQFNKLYPVLVLDEWLSKMNHRGNRGGDYNDVFIPFMKSITHMRHQGINQVYVASQLDTTDIQLMGMFTYIHEVEIDLDISYWEWVKTGSLEKHIRGWKVWTYVTKKNKGKTDKTLFKKWYEPKIMDMTNFNSLNQASEFENIPYDNIKIKRSHV